MGEIFIRDFSRVFPSLPVHHQHNKPKKEIIILFLTVCVCMCGEYKEGKIIVLMSLSGRTFISNVVRLRTFQRFSEDFYFCGVSGFSFVVLWF